MKIYFSLIAVIVLITLNAGNIFSQVFVPGNTYYDAAGYVEYRAGNLPVILSVPHGGSIEPIDIPDRICPGCVYDKDAWTIPIADGLYAAFIEQTGCYPHVIINLLHRKKFDANRDIDEAADGNLTVEKSWYAYHLFIDSAKSKIANDYGRGLFLDIHGHAHTIQRIELGYLLSGSQLQLSDFELNSNMLINESSIRGLVVNNILGVSHAELLRGSNSFGELLNDVNFLSVPSLIVQFPATGESYFNGGYNTLRHGSKLNDNGIDAIQIELNKDIRYDAIAREMLIDSLTAVINHFVNLYYNNQYLSSLCNLIVSNSVYPVLNQNIKIYPNPVDDCINIQTGFTQFQIEIYNYLGQKIHSELCCGNKVNVDFLPSGLYILHLKKNNIKYSSMKFIKK